ncbi:polyphosphate kinase 1 [Polynucleobacter sp. IMCC30063]|uniref:polyphosphate kinase 1 n=1 Tax=Polynucleobacter sp. IMCC30063 TaxID=2907298 RepID=UPI001F15A5E1|nr:polyphosphate kinase 1 [Polynucleobacter sp. IMCC30063]MCE7505867.1 polyphosphate kinase 1 [Polynucleobacter sp. IMCC30063]
MVTPLLNREIGILEFNSRVLSQAEDPQNPLLERLRFLSIVSNNLDEFFEVRVSGLKEQLLSQPLKLEPDGLTIQDCYQRVAEYSHHLVARQYEIYQKIIIPQLATAGIRFLRGEDWTVQQRRWANDFFRAEILPLLTPIALDPAHPFPRVGNKSLNFIVSLTGKDAFGRDANLAVVQAPRALPRVIQIPKRISDCDYSFVLLSALVQSFVAELFPGLTILQAHAFRVTRNSELFVSDDEATDLREALQGELPTRHLGDAVRLEVSADTPSELLEFLRLSTQLEVTDCYRVNGPVNLVRLSQIPDFIDRPNLKFPIYQAAVLKAIPDESLFHKIHQGDILLHHPYESFEPVLQLLREAAQDPDVLAIKQTVYRTGDESPVMEALMEAARNGKEVTVVLELLARFDEQTNINWASKLESVGAHVVYGVVGHKCHAKMLLIVRREIIPSINSSSSKAAPKYILQRYVHLGTGNYHPRTAKLYTDFGLMTCNPDMTSDAHQLFQQLTGTGLQSKTKELLEAPFTLLSELIKLIRTEARAARDGKKALIIAKMNALLEPTIIEELYKASQAGVKIELIVRGVCALKPGVKGLSDNIQVRSIIGRFLEHHRIYYFYNSGNELVYLSSADWMERNLLRRVEVAFPIKDAFLKQKVIQEGLKVLLSDNASAWQMNSDGSYQQLHAKAKQKPIIGQNVLMAQFSNS